MRHRLYIAAGAAALLVAAFVAGRYSAPVRVETKTEWKEITSTVTEWAVRTESRRVEGPVREVERIVEKPGAERVITRWIERGSVTTDTTTDSTGSSTAQTHTTSATSTVTETRRPGWAVGVGAEWDPGRLYLSPGRVELNLDRRLFGTLWFGARASSSTDFSDLRIGAAVRLEF